MVRKEDTKKKKKKKENKNKKNQKKKNMMEEFHREVNFGLAPWFLLHHMFVSASALVFGATSMYTTLHLQTKQEVSTQLQNHTFHIHTLHCFFCELLFLEGAFTCQHLETFGEKLENRRLEPLLNAVIVSSIRTHTCTPFLPQLARAGTHKQFCHGTNVPRETTIFNSKAIQQITLFPPL